MVYVLCMHGLLMCLKLHMADPSLLLFYLRRLLQEQAASRQGKGQIYRAPEEINVMCFRQEKSHDIILPQMEMAEYYYLLLMLQLLPPSPTFDTCVTSL